MESWGDEAAQRRPWRTPALRTLDLARESLTPVTTPATLSLIGAFVLGAMFGSVGGAFGAVLAYLLGSR